MAFMKVSDAAIEAYTQVRTGKLQGMVLRIVSDGQCELISTTAKSAAATSQEFAADFHRFCTEATLKGQCSFMVYNLPYISPTDKVRRGKTLFLNWAPTTAQAKFKMLNSFCSLAIKRQLGDGISSSIQTNDQADLDYSHVLEKALAHCTVK
jgi:Cofilin/tropomyosin-type actin-binding protein